MSKEPMLTKIRTRYSNLSIRSKLTLGFGFLMAMLLIVIASHKVIEVTISDPANRSLREASAETLLATKVGFEFERARYEEKIFETYYTSAGFNAERMDGAYQVVLTHLGNALDLLNSVDTADEPGEAVAGGEASGVEALRGSLESYNADIYEIVNNLLPNRGNLTTGMGRDIYAPLEEINAVVDAGDAMALATAYINAFEPKVVAEFPDAIAALKESIEAADLPAEQKQTLLAQADSSLEAFQTLVTHDSQILVRYMSVVTATETLTAQLADFIANEEQAQVEAQTQLDDADRIRTIVDWGVAVLTILAGLIMARLIYRSISQPVMALSEVARRAADGDYSQRAMITSSSEVGQLAQAFNNTIAAVSEREFQLREQTEKLRMATAQAKEASRIKSEFLANVSHELRTPLNAIIGFSDMLLMGMSGALNEKQEHKVRRLRDNGTRLLDLINDILDLTRIEARRVELATAPFAPQALFTRIAGQMEVLAQKKGLAFEVSISPDLPKTLVGDEQRVEQIVVNLLSNAFKFTQEGTVALRTEVNSAKQTWTITVSDTGIGVPPHARTLIFEEFRQLDGTSTRAYKGTGLGLAITRNLVRIMNGEISVESELGRGSVFIVTLPLVTEDSPAVESITLEAVEG